MIVLIVVCVLFLPAILIVGIMFWRKKSTAPPPVHYQQPQAPVRNQVLQLEDMHPAAPAPPANDAADYMEASLPQQIMYDAANEARAAEGQRGQGLYVEPSHGQMAEYDAANAAARGKGGAGGAGLIYDKPGAKGGTLKAPVYAEYAPGMENGAAYGPVGDVDEVVVQCARGGVAGWSVVHTPCQ